MRLRPVLVVSLSLALASLAACEIHTGDGTQPATPATPAAAAPATTTAAAPAEPTPIEQEHRATSHIILKNDGGA